MTARYRDFAASAALMVYAAAVVVTPLSLVAMREELQFSLGGGGALEAARTILLLLTLFAGGAFSSRLGKARTVGAGLLVAGASLIAAGHAQSYWTLMGALLTLGFGTGFAEALINPLVHNNHPEGSGKALNVVNAFFSLGVVAAVTASGFLLAGGVTWRELFTAAGIVTFIPAVLLLVLRRGEHESGSSVALESWMECVRQPAFRILAAAIFFGGACEAAFTFWSASYIQLHYQAMPSAAGIGTAIFAGAMFIGRLLFGRFTLGYRRSTQVLLLVSLFGILVSVAAFLTGSLPLFYLTLFGSGLAVAPYWPTIQAISPGYVRGDATLHFILLSTAGIPGIGAAAWIMGVIADRHSLQAAFMLIPFFFIGTAVMTRLLMRYPLVGLKAKELNTNTK
jgi:fucose permease